MHLGTLIAKLQHEADAADALVALGDIVLFAEVAEAAERFDETPAAYVAASVVRFSESAGDEEWLGLVAAMERAVDPGKAAFGRMIRWAIATDEAGFGEPRCGCVGDGKGA